METLVALAVLLLVFSRCERTVWVKIAAEGVAGTHPSVVSGPGHGAYVTIRQLQPQPSG